MQSTPNGLNWLLLAGETRQPASPGGLVLLFTAGESLNVGAEVSIDSSFNVYKTGTMGGATPLGVVVGGKQTDYVCKDSAQDVGTLAGTVGQNILVCLYGVAYSGVTASTAVKRQVFGPVNRDLGLGLIVDVVQHLGAPVNGPAAAAYIQAAINYVHANGGGVVGFPPKVFVLEADLIMYSDVILQGTAGGYHVGTQFQRTSSTGAGCFIGENIRRVGFRDIGFTNSTALAGKGIRAMGNQPNGSYEIEVHACTFFGLNRGISIEGSNASGDINEGSGEWECDGWDIRHCLFADGLVGIWVNTQNFDYSLIEGCRFSLISSQYNVGVWLHRSGFVAIKSCAFGSAGGELTHTAIREDLADVVNIDNCQAEQCQYMYDYQGGGDYSGPKNFIGCHIDRPIRIAGNISVVFYGCGIYAPITCIAPATNVKFYGFGSTLNASGLGGSFAADGRHTLVAWHDTNGPTFSSSYFTLDNTGIAFANAKGVGVYSGLPYPVTGPGGTIDIGLPSGLVSVTSIFDGAAAIFNLAGGFGASTKALDPMNLFTNTAFTANKHNLYFNGTTYILQNDTAGNTQYRVAVLGGK